MSNEKIVKSTITKESFSKEVIKTIKHLSKQIPSFLDLEFILKTFRLSNNYDAVGDCIEKEEIHRLLVESLMQWGAYFEEWIYWQPLDHGGYYGGEFYRLGGKALPERSLFYQLTHYSQSYQHYQGMSIGRYDGYMLPNQWQGAYYSSYSIFFLQYLITLLPSLVKQEQRLERYSTMRYIEQRLEQEILLAKAVYLGTEVDLFTPLLQEVDVDQHLFLLEQAQSVVKERYTIAFLTMSMTFFSQLNKGPLDCMNKVYVFFDLQQEQSRWWLEALLLSLGHRFSLVNYHLLWQVDVLNQPLALERLQAIRRWYQRMDVSVHLQLSLCLWQQCFDGGIGYDCLKPKAVVRKSLSLLDIYKQHACTSVESLAKELARQVARVLEPYPVLRGEILLGLVQLDEVAYVLAGEEVNEHYYALLEQLVSGIWQEVEQLGYDQVVQLGHYGDKELYSRVQAPSGQYLRKHVRLSWQEQLTNQALAYRQVNGYCQGYLVLPYYFEDQQLLEVLKQATQLGFDALEIRYFGYER